MSRTLKVQLADIVEYKGYKDNHKEPKNHSPVFDYCRKLKKEGEKYGTSLEVYRDDVLALRIPKIGLGAKLAIREDELKGPVFIKHRPFPANGIGRIKTR